MVPAYLRLDARVSRQLKPGLELAVVGQNLLDARHAESASAELVEFAAVRRSVVLRAGWRFGR